MERLFSFIADTRKAGDRHAVVILAFIGIIAIWLLSLPFVDLVQRTTINRFHLTTTSFAAWAVQQPIPPMYNLENRYWYSHRPLALAELTNPPPTGVRSEMINHFPARMVTCASGRLLVLENRKDSWFYLQSRYRRNERLTTYHLTCIPGSSTVRMEMVDSTTQGQAAFSAPLQDAASKIDAGLENTHQAEGQVAMPEEKLAKE